jgi:signal transduction histidine kinase
VARWQRSAGRAGEAGEAGARSPARPEVTRTDIAGPDEPALVREHDGLNAIAEAELGEDPRDVRLYRRLTEVQRFRDFGVGESARDVAQDVELAGREVRQLLRYAVAWRRAPDELLDEPPRDRRSNERLAAGDDADGVDELVARSALENEAARARLHRLVDVFVLVERRQDEPDVVYVTVLVGAVWQAGRVIRRRRLHAEGLEQHAARLERDREEQARGAVADERARIARELHDVVAHSVSVAVVQAEAGETLLERDPDAARQAFVAIQDTGRQALAELSRLLGIMRKDGDAPNLAPPASISRLAPLVEEMRAAGLPVDIVVDGRPRQLAPGVDLSAYRIVQEALTNTLKHAGPAHAVVRVTYDQRALEVEVTDDGAGTANGADRGGGHGLVGMRERVTLYGGELEAGRRPEGGYAVRARLPLEPAERR